MALHTKVYNSNRADLHGYFVAIFAQTSGLPLKISIDENSMDTQSSFFADVTALGDILDAEGYQQAFLCGSDAAFGGRKLYFTDHGDFDNQYANVMACSSRQVSAFVSWVQEQDFYENTTIVIVGDHPTMDSDFCAEASASGYDRKVYVSYINAAAQTPSDAYRDYSTFDMFPTTLAALGVEIEGDRLGLGTNLFSETETLSEAYGNDYMMEELNYNSHLMEELGDITEIETSE